MSDALDHDEIERMLAELKARIARSETFNQELDALQQKIDAALQNAPADLRRPVGKEFVIWSIEHDGWWKPSRFGYTRLLREAGRYSREEAEAIVRQANVVTVNECAIPITCLR